MAKKSSKNKEAETANAEAPAAVAEAPKRPTQNGVSRPSAGTATGRVWEIADSLSESKGAPADRADVVKAAEAEGLNSATISTQWGRWRKFHGLAGVRAAKTAEPAADGAEVEA